MLPAVAVPTDQLDQMSTPGFVPAAARRRSRVPALLPDGGSFVSCHRLAAMANRRRRPGIPVNYQGASGWSISGQAFGLGNVVLSPTRIDAATPPTVSRTSTTARLVNVLRSPRQDNRSTIRWRPQTPKAWWDCTSVDRWSPPRRVRPRSVHGCRHDATGRPQRLGRRAIGIESRSGIAKSLPAAYQGVLELGSVTA